MGMEIDSAGSMNVSAAQMQARFETAQAQRLLNEVSAAGAKAEKAVAGKAGATEKDKAESLQKLVKVSKDFESIFLGYLLKTMRDTVPKAEEGMLGSSRENAIFTSMHDEELAKSMSQAGGIGLGRMMVEQLKKSL